MPPSHRRSRSTQPLNREPATPADAMRSVEATSAPGPARSDARVGQPRRSRNVLHRDKGRFRAIVELAPDALVVADWDGHIVLVNRQTEALFGYAREELLGQPVEMLIPPRFHATHQQHRAQYVAAPRTRTMGIASSLFGRRRDGSEFPVEISLSPLDDEDIGERLVISSIRDISELQRDETARAAAESANIELRAVRALTDTALSHLAQEDLLAAMLDHVLTIMGVDHAAILLLEAGGQQLMVRAARGLAAAVATQVRIPLGQGFAGRIAATRAPLIVDDLSTFPVIGPFLRQTLRSVAGVPLLIEERLIGVVSVGTATTRRFAAADIKLLEQVAKRIALAIDRVRLLEAEQAARREAERERVRWQAAMDSAPEFVITCDADRHITYVNPAYESLRGGPADPSVPPEERAMRYGLLTPDGAEFFPAEQRPLSRAVREGQAVHGVEMVHRTPTGEERLVVWEAAPMRTAQGMLLGAVAIGHDITERTQLEREREQARAEAEQQTAQLQATFEAMADGVAVFDTQGHVVRENAAQQRLLGMEAAPPNYADLPLPERMALFAARDEHGRWLGPDEGPLPRALRGEVVSGAETTDLRSRTLDGRELELNVSAAPLRDREGRLTGVVAVFRDQTEHKRLAREREQALISEQATHEVNQRMRQFLAIASHDLRNPVTTALGTVQVTERRVKQLAAATAKARTPTSDVSESPHAWMLANLATVNQALHRLNRLIGRLFDVTQAQTGHLELRMARHDLIALVRAAVLAQRSASPDRTILLQIAPDRPVPVAADADRLDQVLTNYLANAIKYSPADRPVEVHLEVEGDVQVRVSVCDQGPGLAPDEQEHVWEPFHRVPGLAVQGGGDGGLGLGLYLCKTLVELHGGQVGLDSARGHGATFWFTLPLDHVAASTSA